MLFGGAKNGKKERKIARILIVEDEPLVAFDNEYFLRDAGYEIVATVDTAADAVKAIERDDLDLVLSDVSLSKGGTGVEVAKAAQIRGTPLVFVTGSPPDNAASVAMGILAKPYSQRDLLATIEAVEASRAGRKPKRLPKGLTLFDTAG